MNEFLPKIAILSFGCQRRKPSQTILKSSYLIYCVEGKGEIRPRKAQKTGLDV